MELEVTKIKIISKAEIPFELGSEVNLDTYLDHMPFTLRSEKAKQIFKVQEAIIQGFRDGMKAQDFTEFQAPALVGGDAEGGAAAFKLDYYYDQKAFLATSPQIYKQIMVGVFERAFTTPKIFRGEKHSTTRHLSEYSSLDFEMGFIKDHTDVMAALERTMHLIVDKVGLPVAMPATIPVLKLR